MKERIAHLRSLVSSAPTYALTPQQISSLKSQGNTSSDPTWRNVRALTKDTSVAAIYNCSFEGQLLLEGFDENSRVRCTENVRLPSGLYNTAFSNCVVLRNARVADCTLLSSTIVGEEAAVVGCGIINNSGKSSFGNGISISVAVENGGREVASYAEVSIEEASRVVFHRDDPGLQKAYLAKVEKFVQDVSFEYSVIDTGACVLNAPYLVDVFIGAYAVVRAPAQISNSTLLSSKEEVTSVLAGSDVRSSILQQGTEVDSMSIVEESIMCVASHVEKHGKLLFSILGPISGVSEGEVNSSLVGPFVGFHHQSLLIASYWPAGRGNVGYGANVGSNHTGKAPDQELWPGEGVFFGLGSSIKFPSNFSEAPYTLIATGAVTLPQKVSLPFSLITTPAAKFEEFSPALNELQPAWILSDNLYMVLRNESKFKKRGSKSGRLGQLEYRIFRPSIIDLVITAINYLEKPRGPPKVEKGVKMYGDKQIEGVGKNVMSEGARIKGIETYRYFVDYYALRGLWEQLVAEEFKVDKILKDIAAAKPHLAGKFDHTYTGALAAGEEERAATWAHQCSLLRWIKTEDDVKSALGQLIDKSFDIVEKTKRSKGKDDARGARIIPGYKAAHKSAEEDKVVAEAEEAAVALEKEISLYLKMPLKSNL